MEQNTRDIELQNIRNYIRLGLNGTQCLSFQQLSVTTAAKLTVPEMANTCIIDITNSGVSPACRYRLDGVAPTSTIGGVLSDLDTIEISGNTNMNAAIFITVSGTSVLNIHYFA